MSYLESNMCVVCAAETSGGREAETGEGRSQEVLGGAQVGGEAQEGRGGRREEEGEGGGAKEARTGAGTEAEGDREGPAREGGGTETGGLSLLLLSLGSLDTMWGLRPLFSDKISNV